MTPYRMEPPVRRFMSDGPMCSPEFSDGLFDIGIHLKFCQFVWFHYEMFPCLYAIPQPVCLVLRSSKDNRRGEYCGGQIRVRMDHSLEDILETYAHEYRHHLQRCRKIQYSDEVMSLAQTGSYWYSPIEIDARMYAERLVGMWHQHCEKYPFMA